MADFGFATYLLLVAEVHLLRCLVGRRKEELFEQNPEFLKEETISEMSGLGVRPWFRKNTVQHKKNLSD